MGVEKVSVTEELVEDTNVAIDINNVAANYGLGNIIENIDFHVKKGETFGIVGLNGVGKTTLIKIILGLMDASEGDVKIFGKEAVEQESKSKIAYLPEKFEPPTFLSGFEFIKFSLSLYNKVFKKEAVEEAADRVSLARESLSRRVTSYSKGMRQKTGLMGTWLTECPLLVLDEPMSGLDPRARVLVKDEIMSCKKRGMTVFLTSHILADMDEMCDRIGVIHDGELRFIGTPADLKKQTDQEHLERAFLKVIEKSKRVYES